MTIAAITIIKNGSDIVEPFIRHNAAHIDYFLVCDHQSTDGTPELIERLKNEGYPIFPYRVCSDTFHQARWMTFLAHEAKALIPQLRYVVPLDVDEFIQMRDDSFEPALDAHFERYTGTVCFMPWVTYVPTPDDDETQPNPILRITHRFASEPAQFHKVILPARAIRFLLNVGAGSHAAMYHRHKLKGHVLDNVALCHFPIRSLKQVRRKALEGTSASRKIQKRKPGVNIHWKQLADSFETNAHGMDDIEFIARRYLGAELHNETEIVLGDFSYLGSAQPDAALLPEIRPLVLMGLKRLWFRAGQLRGKSVPLRKF